jgi:tetratricopeptide (TPR) repeat protein
MYTREIPSEDSTEHDAYPVRGPADDDTASIRTLLPVYSVRRQQAVRPPSPTPTYYSVPPSPTPTYCTVVPVSDQENRTPPAPLNPDTKTLKEIEKYERTVTMNPHDAFAWAALGHMYSPIDYHKAIEAYQTAIKVGNNLGSSNIVRIRLYLGSLYASNGDIDEALNAYKSATAIAPDNSVAWRCSGDMYKVKRIYRHAVHAYKLALEKNHADEAALLGLAETYKQMGDYANAIDACETFTKSHLDHFKAWKTLVGLYTFKSTAALEATPNPSDLWQQIRLAEIFFREKDYVKAIEIYKTEIEKQTSKLWMYKRLGELYEAKGEDELAVAEYVRVIKEGPYDYELANCLAQLCNAKVWKDNRGIEICEEILNLKPLYHSIRKCLGEAYETKGNNEQAIKLYELVLDATPSDISLRGHVGEMYEKIGDINKAIEIYEAVCKSRPADTLSLRLHLQRLYKTRSSDQKKKDY